MDLSDRGTDLDSEDTLRVDELETDDQHSSTLCLIGKVISNKSFNAFGFLEAMKKAMNPPLRFTLFERNIVALKELERGEQPSAVAFNDVPLWIRIYNLPIAARNEKVLLAIANKCGKMIEIDPESINGISRSARLKVRIDLQRPLKKGLNLELQNSMDPF
ncbi:hypothetical protein ACS0TY_013918 [Phlomoides rotata]